jgi:aerobic-type carbon monoxide dehydrogenase small subunit (CoxS/CutS family)
MEPRLDLTVNGRTHEVRAAPAATLLSVLRDELDLTGTKYGCGEGECGACTVLLDGLPVRSCITPVGSVGERPVRTVEGLEREGRLHPVQEAFLAEGALQCGFCTTGMIVAAVGLLERQRAPGLEEIRRALDGNVCRCGTYSRIVAAVQRASAATAEAGHG